MLEQLGYLISHASECQRDSCDECRRLKAVESLLLQPFKERPWPMKRIEK
jgi:hypothetical protein